jgi:5'-nucleotidase
MRILLVNDDGIHADGLHALWQALNADGHDVFVCVPDRQRSACRHGITTHNLLRIRLLDVKIGSQVNNFTLKRATITKKMTRAQAQA